MALFIEGSFVGISRQYATQIYSAAQ